MCSDEIRTGEEEKQNMKDLMKYLHRSKLDIRDFIKETEECPSIRSYFTDNGAEICLNDKGINFLLGSVE